MADEIDRAGKGLADKEKSKKTIFGVGVNDSPINVYTRENGKRVPSKIYTTWKEMLRRCYDKKSQGRMPTYAGCSVADEWHLYSNFADWMSSQKWEGLQLDKDLLVFGNKVYSQSTCVFISKSLNCFLTESISTRGPWPLGVSAHKRDVNKFTSRCSNPFTGEMEYLGRFVCPDKAHKAWRKRKHELACIYADQQTDERIADALRARYSVTEVSNG